MKLSISMAGLSDELKVRLELALKLLGAHGIFACLSDWDGTPCNAAVVDVADAYGSQVMEIALRLEIPVFAFAPPDVMVNERAFFMPQGLSVRLIAQRLQGLMLSVNTATPDTLAPLMVTLACSSEWASGDVAVSHGARRIVMYRSSSRVWAKTLSDLLYCRDRFGLHDWRIQPATRPHTIHSQEQVSSSLDTFLLEAALLARLPRFMPGLWRLSDWPDLGPAPDLLVSMRVANLLLRQPMSANEVTRCLGIDEVTASGCMWALLASGLLRSETRTPSCTPSAMAVPTPANGLLTRLARRFGLMP